MVSALRVLAIVAVLGAASPIEAATLKIVAIGASNTAGFLVGSDKAYPARLQAILRQRGIDAEVTSAGVIGDVTGGMLRRIDADVPKGTDIVILQPGTNDLRFFGTKEQRTANIAAMVNRLHARGIRVVIYDPNPIPPDDLQWDGIHYTAAAHSRIAAMLAAKIAPPAAPQPTNAGAGDSRK
jgi:acyl-CoA thioesterase I